MEINRTCKTCAWFTQVEKKVWGTCHYEPKSVSVEEDYWCRHHTHTRGWREQVETDKEV